MLRGESRPHAVEERLDSARRVVVRLSKRADELSAMLADARTDGKLQASNELEVELHRTREVLQTAIDLVDVLSGVIGEKAPERRKELEEQAKGLGRKLEVQLDRLGPRVTQPDDLVALMALTLMRRQAGELGKNREFFDKRLKVMRAVDRGKTSIRTDEVFSVVGRGPDSIKRLTKIVELIDEWLVRHGRLEKKWDEAEVVALFKLKSRADRLMLEEFDKLGEALVAWANVPEERPVAFAEDEPELAEEEVKEEPIKERR